MKKNHYILFNRLILRILPLCTLILSCNSSMQPQPQTPTTIIELKITNSEIPGWSASAANSDTFCVYPIDSLKCCYPGSVDGGATPYETAGCKEVAYQTLTGPSEMIYSSHSMDFVTTSKATSMFTSMKSLKSPVISITGFDTSIAFASKALQSFTVYAHFNKYYFEFYILGVTDDAAGLDAAAHFLTLYKSRIK